MNKVCVIFSLFREGWTPLHVRYIQRGWEEKGNFEGLEYTDHYGAERWGIIKMPQDDIIRNIKESCIIKTEEEYQSKLSDLDGLMDAIPGSQEEMLLDLISATVEKYEKEHYPIGE